MSQDELSEDQKRNTHISNDFKREFFKSNTSTLKKIYICIYPKKFKIKVV